MLRARGLDLHYGTAQVLRGVSLTVEPGRVTCLLGRNWVGKTSIVRALVGVHPVSAETIELEDRDVTRLPAFERARLGMGYVPQGRGIFPLLIVRENLETALAAAPPEVRELPADVFELFPVLCEMLHRRGGDLSGGQQQLAIARALVGRPRYLVLDEPTEGIQPNIVRAIADVLHRLRDGGRFGILLVEQYLDFAPVLAGRFV